jgi:hypothetical protein
MSRWTLAIDSSIVGVVGAGVTAGRGVPLVLEVVNVFESQVERCRFFLK